MALSRAPVNTVRLSIAQSVNMNNEVYGISLTNLSISFESIILPVHRYLRIQGKAWLAQLSLVQQTKLKRKALSGFLTF